ncbi:hypothetical protein BVC80_8607g11 [Macleaya cordata]|uniref:Vacuolar ATPase assembly protein VMA22 n=1 Tax=Macleaya cordata TaxID=56857 RepID=A0A200PYM1_MACCD|nr:hypothetical protein BVC80_8607g11 [Macleaya cordata]
MGSSRVTSSLFDLKLHPAATTLRVTQLDDGSPLLDPMLKQPHFTLSKWVSSRDEKCSPREIQMDEEELDKKSNSSQLRHRGTSQVEKERSKSLSVFGTLVSPKLRAAQLSFETALDTLVEIANMRSLILSAYTEVKNDVAGTEE